MKCRHQINAKLCDICREKTEEILYLLHEAFFLGTISEETLLSSTPNPGEPISCIGTEICWLKPEIAEPENAWPCRLDQRVTSLELPAGKFTVDLTVSFALTAITSSLFQKKETSSEITLPCTVTLGLFKQDERHSLAAQLLLGDDPTTRTYQSTISPIPEAGSTSTSSAGMFPSIGTTPTSISLSTIVESQSELRLIPCLTIEKIGTVLPNFNESEPFIVGSSGSIVPLKSLSHFKLKCHRLVLRCQKLSY